MDESRFGRTDLRTRLDILNLEVGKMMRVFRSLATASSLLVAAFALVPRYAYATSTRIALADCFGRPTVEPSEVVLSCADGGFSIQKIQWTGWGESFAAGMGRGSLNDCTPNCGEGHFHNYPMLLVVTGRQTCPNGQSAYAKITYAFIGRAPFSESPSEATQRLPCKPMP